YKPISTFSLNYLIIKAKSKSKKIKSSDFKEWAFTLETVTVYSHKDYLFFVEIDNKVFALTGKTSTRFKIPIYFKSKNLKPRMVATYLLDEAKKLREQ